MFSKKPEQNSTRPTSKPVSNSGATFSVIGPDVTIRGDVEAAADLHVDGTVIGDVACSALVQGESSRIEGAIKAESARLSGQVKGTIEARELVILQSAGIEGDVSYKTLTIEQGAAVDGRFVPQDKGAAEPAASSASDASKAEKGEPRLSLAG